jgi:tripartite-type tricarboxylate transporter receptor subunit TctC
MHAFGVMRVLCRASGASFLTALVLPILAFSISTSFAQAPVPSWPQKPVRFILPFGPASGADTVGRLFADRLSARWNKPVVIDNRPGGDGLVAINAFTSANDDHVLFLAPTGTFLSHPYEHDILPYDAERDLVPVVGVATIVLAVTVPASLDVHTLGEFVALARAQPGKLNAATAAGHANFLWQSFLKSTGLQVTKVPYRDVIPAIADLAEGRIQIVLSSLAAAQPQIQSGKVRLIAITSGERTSITPDTPTVAEAGFPALTLDGLIGLYGPRGMPLKLREAIAATFREVAASEPLIAERLAATGQVVNVLGPEEFAARIKEQRQQLVAIAKELGMKAAQVQQ